MLAPLPALAALLSVLVIGSDVYARRVPNAWLLATLLLAGGMLGAAWVQGTSGSPWSALAGLSIGLAALLPIHVFGWMGAGDVKFFAVLGFLLGAKALLPIWIIGSVLAGTHAIVMLMSRSSLSQAVPGWLATQTWVAGSSLGQRIASARQGREGLPYAAWLGVGALVTILAPGLVHWGTP